MRRPACETMSVAWNRPSIAGLNTATACRAISARRRRRISSSLLPENIGPPTTSSQPPAIGCMRITPGSLGGGQDGEVGEYLRPRVRDPLVRLDDEVVGPRADLVAPRLEVQ